MYLFQDKNEIEVAIKCKLCFQEIIFYVSKEDYEKIEKFPLIREETHGKPPHKLTVYLNKHLEIENFNIEEIERKVAHSKDLTKQVLGAIGLNEEEIDLYFATTGRDILSIGEISVLAKKPKDDVLIIIEKFMEK